MRVLYISFFVVLFDQITKSLVRGLKIIPLNINIEGMPYGSSKELIGKFIKITYIENPGMAFGFSIFPKVILVFITIAASVIIVYFIYKNRKEGLLIRLSLALIFAGAAGNLIDRIFYGIIYNYAPLFYGRVVDFIQVEFWDFTIFGRTYTSWPILNIADLSVSAGFLLILLFNKSIFRKREITQVQEISEAAGQQTG